MARKHTKRLYTDYESKLWDLVSVTDGRRTIEVPCPIRLIRPSKRGSTWDCWQANSILEYAAANPDAFGHPVLDVYVERAGIWVVDRITNGKRSHAVRYHYHLGRDGEQLTAKFDKLGRNKFVRYIMVNYPDGVILRMKPGERGRGTSYSGPHVRTGTHTLRVSCGAMRRAIAARILPDTPANRRRAMRQMRGPDLIVTEAAG